MHGFESSGFGKVHLASAGLTFVCMVVENIIVAFGCYVSGLA